MLALFDPFLPVKTSTGKSLFDQLFNDFSYPLGMEQNITENGELIVSIDLPGLKEEDINIDISNNLITIKAERKTKFSSYSINKSFTLSKEYDKENIKAELYNGVLTLTIQPKQLAPPEEPKRIPILSK